MQDVRVFFRFRGLDNDKDFKPTPQRGPSNYTKGPKLPPGRKHQVTSQGRVGGVGMSFVAVDDGSSAWPSIQSPRNCSIVCMKRCRIIINFTSYVKHAISN